MVEVNSAYMHGICEQIWLNSLCAMSNVKVSATQDGWPAGLTNTIHNIEPCDTHMDQKQWQALDQKGPTATIHDQNPLRILQDITGTKVFAFFAAMW